jgi:hypothetical protein
MALVGDRELDSLIERGAAVRRKSRHGEIRSADRSAASSVLRVQALAGNAAVAALLQRTPTGKTAAAPTQASIADALSRVSVETSKTTVKMLEPWEIFRLVTANTPRKKSLYKQLQHAWSALEAAKKRLAAADAAAAQAGAAPTPAVMPSARHTGKLKKAVAAPAAQRAAAAEAVEKARKRVDAVIEELKKFILGDNDLLRKLKADERSLRKTLRRARSALAALKKRKRPDPDKVRDSEQAVVTLEKELAAIPKRHQEAVEEVKAHIAATSFAPEAVERTVYCIDIEGETVRLYDRVDAYATKFENGLVEAKRAVQAKLDDVLAGTALSESNKKILRAISDNESGGAPWSSVNTYDRAVLTWGLVQWTGGRHSDLTAALTTIKTVAPDSFAERFEKYGIDVVHDQLVITGADGSTITGDAAALGIMGSATLSAVMSRAGLDAKIQQAEVAAAAEQQIMRPLRTTFDVDGPPSDGDKDKDAKDEAAHGTKAAQKKGETVTLRFSDVLTSEFVAGLFADRVVNAGRGSTQNAVAKAVRAYIRRKGVDPADVASWAPDLETALVALLSPFPDRVRPFVKRGCSKRPGSYAF